MGRQNSLDGLRCIAVVSVALFHAFGEVWPGGWAGVDVFFVLSGYLITRSLVDDITRHDRVLYADFYWKRVFRLGPALVPVVFLILTWSAIYDPSRRYEHWLSVIATLTYWMNWLQAYRGPSGFLGHAWSLSIEEQFYVVWPITFSILMMRPRAAPAVLIIIYAAIVAWRTSCWYFGVDGARIYNGSDTHGDGLILGCLVALVDIPKNVRRFAAKLWIVPFILVFAVFLFFSTIWTSLVQTVGLTVAPLLTAWLLIAAQEKNLLNDMLSVQPLPYIGVISYGLYLWHLPLLFILPQFGYSAWWCLAATLVAAIVSYHVLEKPLLDWGRKRLPSRARPQGATV